MDIWESQVNEHHGDFVDRRKGFLSVQREFAWVLGIVAAVIGTVVAAFISWSWVTLIEVGTGQRELKAEIAGMRAAYDSSVKASDHMMQVLIASLNERISSVALRSDEKIAKLEGDVKELREAKEAILDRLWIGQTPIEKEKRR